jgi:hypothetical protein
LRDSCALIGDREAALAAVMEFLKGPGTAEAARLLYQVEVLLLQSQDSLAAADAGGASTAAEQEQVLLCRSQLLAVLGEVVLDESMPVAGVPFCIRLFQEGAQQLLPDNPALKVHMTFR